jgi:hypothetical protein
MKKVFIVAGIAGLAYLAYTQGWLASLGLSATASATPPTGVGPLNSRPAGIQADKIGAITLDGGAGFAGSKLNISSVS